MNRTDDRSIVRETVSGPELSTELARHRRMPAQGGSSSGAPALGLVAEVLGYNRYTVQIATPGTSGQAPQAISAEQVTATNLAEPFDEIGQLPAGTPLLLWPSAGEWFCSQPVGGGEAIGDSYWAKVLSGSGPAYTVRRQIAANANSFADADGAPAESAANTWELSVDPSATGNVPTSAIVRVWAEPDNSGTTQRFFTYPIHAVYR